MTTKIRMLLLVGKLCSSTLCIPPAFQEPSRKPWGSVLHILEKYSRWEKALDAAPGQGGGVCFQPWRVKRNRGLERCHGNGFQ